MLICEKNNHGPLCRDCKHGIRHEAKETCIGARCYTYAIDFAKRNKQCSTCEYKEECYIPERGDNIILFKLGEHCPQYRKRMIYARCVAVK